ncbi:MAG: hypothetical protein Q7U12_16520 [Undibacterium sp.]|nr:hypothetical protein [Undibacterium sp.]
MRLSGLPGLPGLPGLQTAWGLRGGGAIQKFAARASRKQHDQRKKTQWLGITLHFVSKHPLITQDAPGK